MRLSLFGVDGHLAPRSFLNSGLIIQQRLRLSVVIVGVVRLEAAPWRKPPLKATQCAFPGWQ